MDYASSESGTVDSTRDAPAGADIPEAASGTKRRRVALACRSCRIRKSRCNGVRPCESCRRLGFQCMYDVAETNVGPVSKDTFDALEERIKSLESTIREHDARLRHAEARTSDHPRTPPLSDHARGNSLTPGAVFVHVQGPTEEQNDDSGATDGMAISFVDEEDCGFFGPSSNIAFMRHIFRAMARRDGVEDGVGVAPTSVYGTAGFYDAAMISITRPGPQVSMPSPAAHRSEIQANILPPPYETERLIRNYFATTGLLFPYIHESTFLATYHRMLRGDPHIGGVRRTWLGLLNMVLAMSVSTTGLEQDGIRTEESSSTSADIFYRRGRELCRTQMLRGTTLETVQYLLLASQYLQGTQQSTQTWSTHGLAVKAAMSIGLHSRDASSKFDALEQEMRTRTWYGCVLLDRTLSMTFGRPSAIPEEYVRIRLPVANTDNLRDGMSVQFYNSTIILFEIIAGLFNHNLDSDEPTTETDLITRTFNLEQSLTDWRDSLPPSLSLALPTETQTILDNPPDPIRERYRTILTLRYLNTHILLLRPVLTKTLGRSCSRTGGGLRLSVSQTQRNLNETCVRFAEDIISIIHGVLVRPGLGRGFLGAWWFTLYYVLNAALVLFASLLAPSDDANTSRGDRSRQFLELAITALQHLEKGNSLVERCVGYLRGLIRLANGLHLSSRSSISVFRDGLRTVQDMGTPDIHPVSVEYLLNGVSSLDGPGSADHLELGPLFTDEFEDWVRQLS